MNNAQNGFKEDGNYWLRHCGSWFAFPHAAHFVEHPDGGFFADDSGAQIYSTAQAKHPPSDSAPHVYAITFIGRLSGALGVRYEMTARRTADNEDTAILALYDEYEHIHVMHIEEVL